MSKDKEDAAPKKAAGRPAKKIPQLLRGFKDILPAEQPYWKMVRNIAESFAAGYGFEEIGLAILEETSLFSRSIGNQTDIVSKEMFTFIDKSDGSLTLRPEATASVARAYITHGMLNLPQPVKLYYWGPMFRRERPQAGRQRQFHQLGFEALGDDNPVIDAQLILLAYNFFKALGLDGISIQINSIGTPQARHEYIKELVGYFRSKRKLLPVEERERLAKNPLRLLDSKDPVCQQLRADAPQIMDWLDDASKTHFMKVIEHLDELDIPYTLNPYLVRGLDYYTRTVFEIWPGDQEEGAQSALGGGGRYDGLVELLGGRPTPAAGFSCGVERVILQLKAKGVPLPRQDTPEVFLAQIGDQAKIKAMTLFEQLRRAGIRTGESFSKDGLKTQLEAAHKHGVKYVLIIGQKEVLDGTILIRDMESGVQEIIDFKKTVVEIKKKLANQNGANNHID